MKNRIKKINFTKNPETMLEKKEVETYLYYLEDNSELEKIPLPLLTYYVVGNVLINEVNNGGFSQYLTNSSINTLPYLKKCIHVINNEELTSIITDLFTAIQTYLRTDNFENIKNLEYSDELENILSSLDERFYELDKKEGIEKLAKKYYQNNIPSDKLVVEIVKERESEFVHYFTKDLTTVTTENAIEAVMTFVAQYPNINFDIKILRWEKHYRLHLIDNSNSFNLVEIMNKFRDNSTSNQIYNILGFKFSGEHFNCVIFDACDENKDLWRLNIEKSGFEKNEYKIEYFRFVRYNPNSLFNHKIISHIMIGDFDYKEVNIDLFKETLVKNAKTLNNINRIDEEITEYTPTLSTVTNNIYLK